MTTCDHCGYQSVMAHFDEVRCWTCGHRPKQAEPLPLVDEHAVTVPVRPLSKTALREMEQNLKGAQQRAELDARRKRVRELAKRYSRQEIANALGITYRRVELDLRHA